MKPTDAQRAQQIAAAPFCAWLDAIPGRITEAARVMGCADDSWLRKGAFRRTGGIDQAQVEDILDAFGLRIWDLYDEGAYDDGDGAGRVRGGQKTGVPCRMTDEQIAAAHTIYDMEGLSLRALGALLYERFGYRSASVCANQLCQSFIRLGLPRRDRIAAVRATSTRHGRSPRKPYRTDPADFLAYRRGLRLANGDVRGVRCAGVRTQYPRKGEPCQMFALRDSEFCFAHDPRYADVRAARLAGARALLVRQESEAA